MSNYMKGEFCNLEAKYKIEKRSKDELVASYQKLYDFKNIPDSIIMLLSAEIDPKNGTEYFPAPYYESLSRLPVGKKYQKGQVVLFDDLKITFSQICQDNVDSGVLYFSDGLVRIIPLEECNEMSLINGILCDVDGRHAFSR